MGSFYQNGIVANLHDFSYGSSSENNYKKLEKDLVDFSNDNPMELILPSLFSEINGTALPNIINEIEDMNDVPLPSEADSSFKLIFFPISLHVSTLPEILSTIFASFLDSK